MKITELNINAINDWYDFFENRAFVDNNEWQGCYCTACFYPKHNDYQNKSNRRRDYAKWLIETGRMRGYMAYENDKVIGWVNANRKTMITRWNNGKDENEKILSIACFIVQKEYRGKGVATSLLSQIISDSLNENYNLIEAYPKKRAKSEYGSWNGPYEMYKKFGFEDYTIGTEKVVRKNLTRAST